MLITPQLFINMITRIFRITSATKYISLLAKTSGNKSISPIQLMRTQRFSFADGRKNEDPRQPIKQGQPMKQRQLSQGQGKPKVEQQDGMQATSFGNTMLIASSIALLLALAYISVQQVRVSNKKKSDPAIARQSGVGKAQIGGQWELIDTKGKPFGSKDLAGSYYLIYFGFTHCPDICPNSLTKISKAVSRIRKTTQGKFMDLKVIFVSVDPDRDTPEKINKFTNVFDPEMIGITAKSNNDPILKECLRKFKIYTTKLQFEDENAEQKGRKSYTIDHTILTYLISDTNEYLTHLGANLGEHDLTKLILEKIGEDRRQKMQKLKV